MICSQNAHFIKKFINTYLKSSLVNSGVAQDIFKFRTRMSNVKNNFHSNYIDLSCPLDGCSELEDDKHLLQCAVSKEERLNQVEINYEKLFSRNIEEQVEIVDDLSTGLIIRDAIMEKQRCH